MFPHTWKEYDFDKATTQHMQKAAKRYLSSVEKLWHCLEEAKEAYTAYDKRMNGVRAYHLDDMPRNPNVDTDGVYKIVTKRERLYIEYADAVKAYYDRLNEVHKVLDSPDISQTNAMHFQAVYLSRGRMKSSGARGKYSQKVKDGYIAVYMNMPDGWR